MYDNDKKSLLTEEHGQIIGILPSQIGVVPLQLTKSPFIVHVRTVVPPVRR